MSFSEGLCQLAPLRFAGSCFMLPSGAGWILMVSLALEVAAQKTLRSGRGWGNGTPSSLPVPATPAPGQSDSQAVDGDGKTEASEALPSEGKGELEHSQQEEDGEEAMVGTPQGLFPQGGKGRELEHKQEEDEEEEEHLSREWEDKRWSRMDQLAKELTAEKRLEGEDDPDRSMKLSFRTRAYGFRDPEPQLRRGWRPSSREDSVEARSDFEEKKEEEGSANRRAEVGIGKGSHPQKSLSH